MRVNIKVNDTIHGHYFLVEIKFPKRCHTCGDLCCFVNNDKLSVVLRICFDIMFYCF